MGATVRACVAAAVVAVSVAACGESKRNDAPASGAGAGGGAGIGAAAGRNAGAGAGGSGAQAGTSSSVAGRGGSGGAGGQGAWAAACNGVTNVGRCVNEVYEWCDHSERGIRRIDCGALGMTCRAEPHELGSDFTDSGCFGDPCTDDEDRCDGTLLYQCRYDGIMSVHDCVRRYGAEGTCGTGQFGTPSCRAPDCEPHGTATCDGNIAIVCGIDGDYILYNCAEQDPAGTCTVMDGATYCGGANVQPI